MLNLLLVEDNIDLASGVIDYFSLENIRCDYANNGVSGLNLITENAYQVIILDLGLPQMDGLTLCRNIREQGIDTPVIMLTARDALADKIKGFDAGADDYLVKPFDMDELVVRVRTLSRRRSGQMKSLTIGKLKLNLLDKTVYCDDQLLKLSPTGLKILTLLMSNSPNAVSRNTLIERIWGDASPDSNSLKVHIHHLRKQLDLVQQSELLHTIKGHGFAFRLDQPHE
ncbi:response regulator transcription factor [Psychromonas sp. Urea-02u-13]|uniref:response regulator transcription factor n=1 Tax=Psychromonas sp. Urea-02u-13 TaxID=2058326 RepID=UPI000C3477FC|nr:response regulator transcription factor [Psychromonas sp. Urea-02u-13]PKG40032.1 two-component system response regulator [Psychromonas sp. Urea-02u-13]